MPNHGNRGGWTGTIFVTTIAVVVMAVLAFAMSGHRDAHVSRSDAPSSSSSN